MKFLESAHISYIEVLLKSNRVLVFKAMDDKSIEIRLGLPGDLEELVAFDIAQALETDSMRLERHVVEAAVTTVLNSDNYGFYLVAIRQGQLVASVRITCDWATWRNGMFWWIRSVYVIPAFRRLGLFSKLCEELFSLAERKGNVCGLRLFVGRDNKVAMQSYERVGIAESQYVLFERMLKEQIEPGL